MNKICTSIEQSQKLLELGIDRKTADMCWQNNEFPIGFNDDDAIPAWSLSALMNLLPNINDKQPILTTGRFTGMWYCYYEDEIDTMTYDNAIDAVFEMIILLKENGKI